MSRLDNTPIPLVRLWRIELPRDGIGPFNSTGWDEQPRPHLGRTEVFPSPHAMPTPYSDHIKRVGREVPGFQYGTGAEHAHLKFAFPSPAELRRWFNEAALRILDDRGYVVKVVAAPWDHHTRYAHQVRYDSTRAITLSTLTPSTVPH